MTDQEIITMAGEYGAWLNGTEIVFTDRGLVEFARALGKAEKQDVDWEAVAADQAMTIAIMKSEQAEFQELVAKVQELEKQACEIIRREWVPLTNEEILEIDQAIDAKSYTLYSYTRAIEAKLKEKNTGVTGDK